MQERPITTLFLMTSVDGKISTGDNDELDVDSDFKNIEGVKEGLNQYYEIEQNTDLWSLNTGRVMEKIGINNKSDKPNKTAVSFVIVDNKPHLKKEGIIYLSEMLKNLIVVTENKNHPAFLLKQENVSVIFFEKLNLKEMLKKLINEYDIKAITIQSGGTMNEKFLREKLIDNISIVVAPILIGGKNTATLIDGKSITQKNELHKLSALSLTECKILKNSYIHLRYKVIN